MGLVSAQELEKALQLLTGAPFISSKWVLDIKGDIWNGKELLHCSFICHLPRACSPENWGQARHPPAQALAPALKRHEAVSVHYTTPISELGPQFPDDDDDDAFFEGIDVDTLLHASRDEILGRPKETGQTPVRVQGRDMPAAAAVAPATLEHPRTIESKEPRRGPPAAPVTRYPLSDERANRQHRLEQINTALAAAAERMLDAEGDPDTMAAVLAESRRLREQKNALLAAIDSAPQSSTVSHSWMESGQRSNAFAEQRPYSSGFAGSDSGGGQSSLPSWTPDKTMMKAVAAKRVEASDDAQWRGQNFAWSQELRSLNRERFGNAGFRHNQLSIMNASLSGKDVFVLMPTG